MSTAARNTGYSRGPTSFHSGVRHFAKAIWYLSRAKLKGALKRKQPNAPVGTRRLRWFPLEIVEMFISRLTHDIATLKACAATCSCWYHIATPHIHRTLILQKSQIYASNGNQSKNPLPSLLELGLLAFVKHLEFKKETLVNQVLVDHWVAPTIFDSRSMQCFRAMVNLQELKIGDLDFTEFLEGFEKYLGHFSPTLRSVALSHPNGTRRQLLNFFMLFPMLDNVEILCYHPRREVYEPLDGQLTPITGGLRGRLTLDMFGDEGLLKDMIVAFGGLRFTSMDLGDIFQGTPLLLKACGETLRTLRLSVDRILYASHPQDFSYSTVLQTIEFQIPPTIDPSGLYTRRVKRFLSAFTSPAFSEIVFMFSESDVDRPSESLASMVREFYEIKEFRVNFCLMTLGDPMVENLRRLTLETERAAAAGLYDFLPCPPLVFSSPAAESFCELV